MHCIDRSIKVKRADIADLKGIIFHDSSGFESEAEKNNSFGKVRRFILDRQKRISFRKQLHCIW